MKLPQMMQIFRRILFTVTLLFFGAATAQAQRPFITDDADVAPRGHFSFSFANEIDQLQRSEFPTLKQNTAEFELDYGLFEGVEIGIEVPFLSLLNASGTIPKTVSGIGDTNFSVKYNFHKERENSRLPAMSLAFNVELPTGDTERELGSGLTDFYMNGVLQKSLSKKTTLRVNGGILFSGNKTTGVIGIKTRGLVGTAGASLVKQLTPKLDLGFEVVGAMTTNLDLSKGQLQALLGGNYQLRKNVTFDFGILAGKYVASPRAGLQLGFTIDW